MAVPVLDERPASEVFGVTSRATAVSGLRPHRAHHGWTQKGFVLLIVLSAEAEDLMLAQLLPTTATTSNQ